MIKKQSEQYIQKRHNRQPARYGTKMHDLFYCKLAGDDVGRCLALAAALQNAPDFVLLEQVFAPEADIFCFIFLPAQKTFRFKCDFVYGQTISSGEYWTADEAAVNHIAEKAFQAA